MNPVSPVIPGKRFPETVIAKDQDEYRNLPAIRLEGGVIITRWKMTWAERFHALFHGNVYLQMWTGGTPVQPVLLQVEKPEIK
jgi:hypothetical protein